MTHRMREQYLDQVNEFMLTNVISIICYPILAAFMLVMAVGVSVFMAGIFFFFQFFDTVYKNH